MRGVSKIGMAIAFVVTSACSGGADNNGASNNGASNNGASNNGASNNGASNNGASNNGTSNNGTAAPMAVSIPFAAWVADDEFSCNGSYTLGTADTPATFTDAKMYVSEVVLIDGSGGEHPVTLTDDDMWQSEAVALLDFEDGSGACANGTAETNTTIRGTIAPTGAEIAAIRFTIGVPFEENHQDAAVAEAPLNLTSMFWNWQGGYKFLRVDGIADASAGFRVHLGSTGCVEDSPNVVTSCANENRATIELTGYGEGDIIAMNLAAFWANVDMTPDAENKSAICHTSEAEEVCEPILEAIDVAIGDNSPSGQTVFGVSLGE